MKALIDWFSSLGTATIVTVAACTVVFSLHLLSCCLSSKRKHTWSRDKSDEAGGNWWDDENYWGDQ